MLFPLYRRPGGIIFLDDDPAYLEMLGEVMPDDWQVRLFMQPADFIAALQAEVQHWESDAWKHQEMVNRWHEGLPLIPQILSYWQQDGTRRFDMTQVCVVDYSMPAMSGLRALSEVKSWPGSRILLTGRADELLGVSAFNRGLIEKFIPKQSPEIRKRLTEAITFLMGRPNERHQSIWRSTLSREEHAVLNEESIITAIQEFAQRHGWVEHVLIGAPFGILALDADGQASWVQLEQAQNLSELADLAESQGWAPQDASDVRGGRKLIDLELQVALGRGKPSQLKDAIALGPDKSLLAAIFPIDEELAPGRAASYSAFLATKGARVLPG